jgi:hypothetical protein
MARVAHVNVMGIIGILLGHPEFFLTTAETQEKRFDFLCLSAPLRFLLLVGEGFDDRCLQSHG